MDSFKRPTFEPSTEVGIRSGLQEDLYLVFAGAVDGTEEAVYRFNINPLVWWVWFGGFVLAFGGIVTMWPGGGPTVAGRAGRRAGYGVVARRGGEGVSGWIARSRSRAFSAPAVVAPRRRGRRGSPQDSLAGRGAVGTLRDPSAVGRPRAPTDPGENEAEIQAIETRLACNCGCTLDVFTCRTTDFSCTYSPALHREVLALRNQGHDRRSRCSTRSSRSTARRR